MLSSTQVIKQLEVGTPVAAATKPSAGSVGGKHSEESPSLSLSSVFVKNKIAKIASG